VKLGQEEIRILGLEDSVGPLLHSSLKHGAWRPLWLCDIGVAIESLPESFAWEICLGPSQTRANWIACAIGLARDLLRVDIRKLPSKLDRELRPWLIDNVLEQWKKPFAINQPPMSHPIPMTDLLRHPSGCLKACASACRIDNRDDQRQRRIQQPAATAVSDGKLSFAHWPVNISRAERIARTLNCDQAKREHSTLF